MCLVYEDDSIGKIFYKKLDDLGNDFEVVSVDYNNLTGSKLNDDNTFFFVDNNNKISLLSKDLSLIKISYVIFSQSPYIKVTGTLYVCTEGSR